MRTILYRVRNTHKYGNGVFAARNIQKGEFIHTLQGKRMTLEQIVSRLCSGKEAIDDPFQIGRRTYIDLDSISRTFNHSCDPNGGLRKNGELFALRDIFKGEEITYDYSSTIAPTDWAMRCKCGSSKCRKIIGYVRSIPKKQLDGYLASGAVLKYIRPIIKELRS